MGDVSGCSSVAVVGAGAAGTLVVAQLCRQAVDRGQPLDILLIDPRPTTGEGVAYSTTDPDHRLNVSAGRISAWPDREEHFLAWLADHSPEHAEPAAFAPRMLYADYLRDVLAESLAAAAELVRFERVIDQVTGLVPLGRRWRVRTGPDTTRYVDAVVLAVGSGTPDDRWAPAELRRSARFCPDPWAPGALARLREVDGDLLLVGTGLTMVDVAVSVAAPGRVVHAVSRHGRLPAAHRRELVSPSPLPLPSLPTGPLSLPTLHRLVTEHVRRTLRNTGDWRSGIDGLRPLNAALWQRLSLSDRQEFLATTSRSWEVRRHRMAAPVAAQIAAQRQSSRLRVRAGEVAGARDDGAGLVVTLADSSTLRVAAVVNCTGPRDRIDRRDSSLLLDLLTSDRVRPGPLGLGLDTDDEGRVRTSIGGPHNGLFTLGSPRRGQLYESTAIPEIRAQARDLAGLLLDDLAALQAPQSARRPRDRYGLALSASPEAAVAYTTALEALLRVQSGAEISLRHAATVDPGFALAHAGLALLGHEWGAAVDVDESLDSAVRTVTARGDERERSFVAAVEARIRRPGPDSSAALLTHIRHYGEDALAVSIAVPTIAFGGATEVPQEAWSLVEGLAPAYGSDWWYAGMLAFVRQEQGRWDEAAALSEQAMAEVPSSGHAVHARTHVYYETGDHDGGLAFLDPWIDSCGRAASHRAHFAWHAALHELSMGDDVAVRRRYAEQLAPPAVSGMRALVDSASLLWRARMGGAWEGELPIGPVLDAVPSEILERPRTAFAALHVAIALAAARDGRALHRLAAYADATRDAVMVAAVAPVARALELLVSGGATGAARCADALTAVLPTLWRVGGSAAQREVVEDTLLYALVEADRFVAATTLLERRLDRRPSPRERARVGQISRISQR